MAIIKSLPGIEVVVRSNSIPFRELTASPGNASTANRVEKLIDVIANQKFEIALGVYSPYQMECDALNFRVNVDGRLIRTVYFRKTKYEAINKYMVSSVDSIRDVIGDEKVTRPLKFGEVPENIDLTDNHTARDWLIGKISVEIFTAQCVPQLEVSDPKPVGKSQEAAHNPNSVPNPASKTDVQSPEAVTEPKLAVSGKKPFATFIFDYRTKEVLDRLKANPAQSEYVSAPSTAQDKNPQVPEAVSTTAAIPTKAAATPTIPTALATPAAHASPATHATSIPPVAPAASATPTTPAAPAAISADAAGQLKKIDVDTLSPIEQHKLYKELQAKLKARKVTFNVPNYESPSNGNVTNVTTESTATPSTPTAPREASPSIVSPSIAKISSTPSFARSRFLESPTKSPLSGRGGIEGRSTGVQVVPLVKVSRDAVTKVPPKPRQTAGTPSPRTAQKAEKKSTPASSRSAATFPSRAPRTNTSPLSLSAGNSNMAVTHNSSQAARKKLGSINSSLVPSQAEPNGTPSTPFRAHSSAASAGPSPLSKHVSGLKLASSPSTINDEDVEILDLSGN
ncbi:hypothetical protein G7Y89_g14443 [Cudoniella acicularis]|uniref:DUF7918 domain-containing protein n=1 Tax=Cudoniella acicularis TaxID=354080 RepID=A0A8H4R2A6_9HELO|nr:hypothetical protein G7Y89_g14443 [Cudoniella acicularis]